MATPLDTSLMSHFEVIFPFLFILVISYAILSSIKVFGDNKGIKLLLSFLLGVSMLFSTIARETINMAAPWFVLLFVFIIFALIAYMALGAEAKDIHGVLTGGNYRYINFWVLGIIVIIIFGSLTSVISKHGGIGNKLDTGSSGSAATTASGNASQIPASEQESEFWSTLFHPKVLGFLLIMLVAFFTMNRLVKE